MKYLLFFSIILITISCTTPDKPPMALQLPSIIADHMVIEQNDKVTLWGSTGKNGVVKVKGSWGKESDITADADGKWMGEVETPEAGGPFELTISTSGDTVVIKDVYAGEVWLASGQSNMEMPLHGWPPRDTVNNARKEIQMAQYPEIRMFTVERAMSASEVDNLKGKWQVCTPKNAGDFSAAAYFFARKLHDELALPIGIIHSSWGGTPAESWVSHKGLTDEGDFNETLKKVDITDKEKKDFEDWTSQLTTLSIPATEMATVNLNDSMAAKTDFNDKSWNTMNLPTSWEQTDLGEFDGVVWFRKEFELDKIPSNTSVLSLGPVDDMDITYVNGKEVGRHIKEGMWQVDRSYEVPSEILKQGSNVIAVKVIDTQGGGGITGPAEKLYFKSGGSDPVDLKGKWKYLPVADYQGGNVYVMGVEDSKFAGRPDWLGTINANTPGVLYNAMIAPIINYTFKGAIWYQGESNVGRAEQYERLFPALIKSWRDTVGQDFPFYFVQIAPFTYGNDQLNASPALRDAQRKTLELPNTGMVVTLDIGSSQTIHPGNKQEVGARLAEWALAKEYGKDVHYSGPLYSSMKVDENQLTVEFDHADDGLVLKNDNADNFEIAGSDGKFYTANAKIEDGHLVVSSAKVSEPVSVRYAWKDTSQASLFNGAGLPASSFSVSK